MTTDASDEHYAFASFRLYPKQRTLLCGDDIVPIGGRAFDVLLLLISQAGKIVSLAELMRFVWPNITVEQANLRVQMGMVRKILARCEEGRRAIETVPMRGYCFILSVQHHGSDPAVVPSSRPVLPVLLNPVIGRDDTLGLIEAELDRRQFVTITGPGGIGKTTAAVAIAHRYGTRFPSVIAFVDLWHAADGDAAASAIAEALGLASQHDAPSALCEHLQGREMLLVLDTCEHIVESVAALAETLLAHCPGLKLLATSREVLRATGEWVYRLPPLTFPEAGEIVTEKNVGAYSALTLFVERVRSSTRFDVQRRDLPVVAEICRRLDGIPLALEFAAARVADLGLGKVAEHLDDRFAILTRGRRTALPRHRTLSATLDWSYNLLSGDEQRLLRHLSNLGSAFTAEHVLRGDCERPPEAFSGLYEKSLLSVDMKSGAPVYRLLDTTRAYVAGLAA